MTIWNYALALNDNKINNDKMTIEQEIHTEIVITQSNFDT